LLPRPTQYLAVYCTAQVSPQRLLLSGRLLTNVQVNITTMLHDTWHTCIYITLVLLFISSFYTSSIFLGRLAVLHLLRLLQPSRQNGAGGVSSLSRVHPFHTFHTFHYFVISFLEAKPNPISQILDCFAAICLGFSRIVSHNFHQYYFCFMVKIQRI
jgi:hypothetical protein